MWWRKLLERKGWRQRQQWGMTREKKQEEKGEGRSLD
jgi:hypothetical protein